MLDASNGCVLHVVCMLTIIKSMRFFFYWQLMIGAFSWVNILGGTRLVSWDYLRALVKQVAFPSLFNLLPSLCSCFLLKKKKLMSKLIFATFYCKLLSFNLYKYIFDRVGGSWDRSLTPSRCTCNLPIKIYIYIYI